MILELSSYYLVLGLKNSIYKLFSATYAHRKMLSSASSSHLQQWTYMFRQLRSCICRDWIASVDEEIRFKSFSSSTSPSELFAGFESEIRRNFSLDCRNLTSRNFAGFESPEFLSGRWDGLQDLARNGGGCA
ncbi:unnamed protein product [Cuscuta campestris]|uniref:Uncharacterized protein n=1 Tax=Cuscuta campestris TaxID=132261 RepID=A0A484L0A3_9ASTE|nr:unnamed protein product [Cuscuta campestris]